jgi:predicted dehydrogenase
MDTPSDKSVPRRDFLAGTGAAAAAAAVTAPNILLAQGAATKTLNIGLVGCGGRGTGAAVQALSADSNVKLTCMADAFSDRLDSSLNGLKKNKKIVDKIDVPDSRKFVGLDAFKQLIDGDVDVVLLTTPPGFRPEQLEYAVAKGKHTFCEKPVAVDSVGVRRVDAACKEAEKKGLAVVSGLCWRYDPKKKATIQKVLDGAIGDVLAMQVTYNTGGLWSRPRKADEDDITHQLRNWLYYTWGSGDHICEQAIHSIDKMGWVMGDEPPLKCRATGGRQSRTDEIYGNVYDHFGVVYEYPNNVRGYAFCRQQKGTDGEVNDYIMGTKGFCNVFRHQIVGEESWRYSGPSGNMYQIEHDELFMSIRGGKPINNGTYMCRSTMLAVMGRMAAYTGKTVTWEQAWEGKENLMPPALKGEYTPHPVAKPGLTKLKDVGLEEV